PTVLVHELYLRISQGAPLPLVDRNHFFAASAKAMRWILIERARHLAEPRPANAPRDWQPAWNVRVRNMPTAMLMPGAAAIGGEAAKPAAREAVKDAAKGMLRGLFGR